MLKLLIADDHPLFRDALHRAAAALLPSARIAEVDSLAGLQGALERDSDIDLLLLDLHMPGASGFSGLVFVRAHYPQVPVIVVSGNEEAEVMRRAMAHGASAYIPKSLPTVQMGEAIQSVLDGDTWMPPDARAAGHRLPADEADIARRLRDLTPQQFRVLMMLADGLLNKQIAWELGVSEATVKAHMTAILKKLGASNRTQAVVAASRLQLDPSTRLPVVEED